MANLMDKADVKKDLTSVAQKIKASDHYAAERLVALSQAVEGGPYANAWAAVSDIHQLIGPDNIVERYKNHRVGDTLQSRLEWIRNTLIFAPLVVTWFGVSQAVEKYNEYMKANPDQTAQPFLLLWQNGFGNRIPQWQTLGTLASIDFFLLTLVLLLTLTVYSISNTIKARREQEAEEIHVQLLHSLSGAMLQLQTRNWQQPTNLLDRFEEFGKQFTTITAQLVTQITTLSQRQQSDFQAFANFKYELAANMKTMSSSASEMKSSIYDLKTAITPLITSTQTLTTQQGLLLTGTNEAITQFKNQTIAQGKVIQEQEKWGRELSKALATLKTTVEQDKKLIDQFTDRMTRLIEEQTKLTSNQGGLLTDMKDEHRELAAFVHQTKDSLNRILGDTGESYKELLALNRQMDDLVRRVAGALPPPPPLTPGRVGR